MGTELALEFFKRLHTNFIALGVDNDTTIATIRDILKRNPDWKRDLFRYTTRKNKSNSLSIRLKRMYKVLGEIEQRQLGLVDFDFQDNWGINA